MPDRMNVPIDEKTRITSDAHNFVIEKMVGHLKDGSENWVGKKFYPSIQGLLRGLQQQQLRDTACESVTELAKAINDSVALMEDLAACITPTAGVGQ